MEKTFSKYAVVINSSSPIWMDSKDLRRVYLLQTQQHYNDILCRKGYVFLRDIYEALGIPLTGESIVCGWVYSKNNQVGDNFIDFQITELDNSQTMVDFNVDGNILHIFK